MVPSSFPVFDPFAPDPPRFGPVVLTLGTFDGVHAGHAALIAGAAADAARRGALPVLCTFAPQPRSVLRGVAEELLCTPAERIERARAAGARAAAVISFTPALAEVGPDAFIDRLLAVFDLRAVHVGFNFCYGARAAGNGDTLAAHGLRAGFDVTVVPPVMLDGAAVSSSRIRDALKAGDAAGAAVLLGRPYVFGGPVVRGAGRGRALLGIPTANLAVTGRVIPGIGVYACRVYDVEPGRTYAGAMNIGKNPTFGENALSVEVHIVDYDGDLYGRELRVEPTVRLRGERPFPGVEALRRQILEDVDWVRRHTSTGGSSSP